jgi:carboxypeptidase family protein/TonB-dependent receptor-like protein
VKTLLFVALLVLPATTGGQALGASVTGAIVDSSGAPLADAVVTIAHVLNGRKQEIKTSASGIYHAVGLLPADYDITAGRDGFASVTRRVTLVVDGDLTVNFTLAPAGVRDRVTVAAETALLEVTRSEPSSTITQSEVEALPILDRNFLTLAQLLPGSGPVNGTVTRFAITRFGGPADQRSGYTTIVDGGDIDDAQWGSPTMNIGQDAVQEFKVYRGQFNAQYGHALNAVVTVVTRSGTNELRGRAFYFGRDNTLNARNPMASQILPFDEQRVGISCGGPLVRDRSHFFAALEGDNVDNVRLIALPPDNPLAATENGVFPAASDNRTVAARLDHRFQAAHTLSLRYGSDSQQALRSLLAPTSDSSQVDTRNRSHRTTLEYMWTPREHLASGFRLYVLNHSLGTTPRSSDVGIVRPSGTIGQTNNDSQILPRTRVVASDEVYIHSGRHDIKFGGEFAYTTHDNDSHALANGVFNFNKDTPFNAVDSGTWPTTFTIQGPSVVNYTSRELGGFVQDDWRLGPRWLLNAGVRYDIDLNLRLNSFYDGLLHDPAMAGLDRFITADRGTDTNNLQPRLGLTWDAWGNGRLIVKGGWGLYVTRNRPWFQLRAMNQIASRAIRITAAACLRFFPDIAAVLGPQKPDGTFACEGSRQIGTLIPDDFVQPYAANGTAAVAWQISDTTALDVNYVHSAATHQTGFTDRNLPASGPINPANPRPVSQFGQVLVLENFSDSWYDALESQIRLHPSAKSSLNISYALSRSYLDGVDFFLSTRGTQRSPHERGYNPSDQRHALAVAGTFVVPWEVQIGGIVKVSSGAPMKVQAGTDLDGDTIQIGDLPTNIPITVGRTRVAESLAAINALRATFTALNLQPIDPAVLRLDLFASLDMRVSKAFDFGRNRLEFLVEAFNLTNHSNLRPPVGSPPNAGSNINSPAFLQRSAARDARQLQWGVRFGF